MTTPHISVLIDTYNHERFLEQAIVSVLEQDFPASEIEIVLVDDGSTDSTPSIVEKFLPQLRYIRKKNGGQASAFNLAIPELRGSIVAFLDRRLQFHQTVLAAEATLSRLPVMQFLQHASRAELAATVNAQAAALSYADAFQVTGLLALLATPSVLLLARKRP